MIVISLPEIASRIRCRRSGKTLLSEFINQCKIEDAIIIPEGATNGDMIKVMLNPYKICEYEYSIHIYMTEADFLKAEYQMNCDTSWWNTPYKEESEGKE